MEKNTKEWKKWIPAFIFSVLLIIIFKLFNNFTDVTVWVKNLLGIIKSFLFGILLAYVLYVPCSRMERLVGKIKLKQIQNHKRSIGVILVYIIVIIIIILLFTIAIPTIANNIVDFATQVPTYYNNAVHEVENLPADSIFNNIDLLGALKNLENIKIMDYISAYKVAEYAQGIFKIASGVLTFIVSLIISMYILLERKSIINFLKRASTAIFKPRTNNNIGKYFEKTNEIFFKFMAGQIFDGLIVGILITVILSIMKVKYAVLLGVFIGVFNLIPYFGAIVAVIISIVIIFLTGGVNQAIYAAIAIVILQQIDSNIINPKIIGNSLKISPLLVIFAITVGGAYFGVIGMFLAVPVFAVIKIIIMDYINLKERN